MYFAWLGFYTTSMLYPAVIGFVLWMLTESDQVGREAIISSNNLNRRPKNDHRPITVLSISLFVLVLFQTSRDICCVVFALFNVVWATLFLERWKRRGAELAYKWGTLDAPAESLEEPRPQFRVKLLPSSSSVLFSVRLFHALFSLQGVKRCSPITGCEEFYYPPWRRRVFRWLVSLPICILCLCFVFLVMLICFELQVSQQSASTICLCLILHSVSASMLHKFF